MNATPKNSRKNFSKMKKSKQSKRINSSKKFKSNVVSNTSFLLNSFDEPTVPRQYNLFNPNIQSLENMVPLKRLIDLSHNLDPLPESFNSESNFPTTCSVRTPNVSISENFLTNYKQQSIGIVGGMKPLMKQENLEKMDGKYFASQGYLTDEDDWLNLKYPVCMIVAIYREIECFVMALLNNIKLKKNKKIPLTEQETRFYKTLVTDKNLDSVEGAFIDIGMKDDLSLILRTHKEFVPSFDEKDLKTIKGVDMNNVDEFYKTRMNKGVILPQTLINAGLGTPYKVHACFKVSENVEEIKRAIYELGSVQFGIYTFMYFKFENLLIRSPTNVTYESFDKELKLRLKTISQQIDECKRTIFVNKWQSFKCFNNQNAEENIRLNEQKVKTLEEEQKLVKTTMENSEQVRYYSGFEHSRITIPTGCHAILCHGYDEQYFYFKSWGKHTISNTKIW